MSEQLHRIEAPHFVAGFGVNRREVKWAAPIISYMVGWDYEAVVEYCRQKKWTLEHVALPNQK